MFLRASASGFFTLFFVFLKLTLVRSCGERTKCASNQRDHSNHCPPLPPWLLPSPPLKVFRVKGFLAPGPDPWCHLSAHLLLDLPVKMSKMCPCPLLLVLDFRWMQWWRFSSNEQRPPQFMQSLWSLALGLKNKHTHTHFLVVRVILNKLAQQPAYGFIRSPCGVPWVLANWCSSPIKG